jgi:hypothetical protein
MCCHHSLSLQVNNCNMNCFWSSLGLEEMLVLPNYYWLFRKLLHALWWTCFLGIDVMLVLSNCHWFAWIFLQQLWDICMFIIWYCRAHARRHDGTAEPVHDVTGLHTSTDAQTTSERTLSLHGQVSYQHWPFIGCNCNMY